MSIQKSPEANKLSSEEVTRVKEKLEAYMKRTLEPEESEAFSELMQSSAVKRLEKHSPSLFKAPGAPDIAGLAEAIEHKAAPKQNPGDWYFQWTYNF